MREIPAERLTLFHFFVRGHGGDATAIMRSTESRPFQLVSPGSAERKGRDGSGERSLPRHNSTEPALTTRLSGQTDTKGQTRSIWVLNGPAGDGAKDRYGWEWENDPPPTFRRNVPVSVPFAPLTCSQGTELRDRRNPRPWPAAVTADWPLWRAAARQ